MKLIHEKNYGPKTSLRTVEDIFLEEGLKKYQEQLVETGIDVGPHDLECIEETCRIFDVIAFYSRFVLELTIGRSVGVEIYRVSGSGIDGEIYAGMWEMEEIK